MHRDEMLTYCFGFPTGFRLRNRPVHLETPSQQGELQLSLRYDQSRETGNRKFSRHDTLYRQSFCAEEQSLLASLLCKWKPKVHLKM